MDKLYWCYFHRGRARLPTPSPSLDFQPFLSFCLQSCNRRTCMSLHVNHPRFPPASTNRWQANTLQPPKTHSTTLKDASNCLHYPKLNPNDSKSCWLPPSSKFCCHGVFPAGPRSVTDLHAEQNVIYRFILWGNPMETQLMRWCKRDNGQRLTLLHSIAVLFSYFTEHRGNFVMLLT